MTIEIPYSTKPEDVTKILQLLPSIEMPKDKVDINYIKSLGFSISSAKHLVNILKQIGFLDETDYPSPSWLTYMADEQRGLVLTSGIKKAYEDLFNTLRCPYLEDDDSLLEYLKQRIKASPKDYELMLQVFRNLSELGDFQDLLCEEMGGGTLPNADTPELPNVKVNPNLQVSIQVHIDPNTPDDKIETIFKNMRKYLLGKN